MILKYNNTDYLNDIDSGNLPQHIGHDIKFILNKNKMSNSLKEREILKTLVKELDQDWGINVDNINQYPDLVDVTTTITFDLYAQGLRTPLILKSLIVLMENNNIIFHKYSNYKLYQKTFEYAFEMINKNNTKISALLKARFLSAGVYSDYIFQDNAILELYKEKLLSSLEFLCKGYKYKNYVFLTYINISQFYLFQGVIEEVESYLQKAYTVLNEMNIPNYVALCLYHLAWLYIEKGKYKYASIFLEKTFINSDQSNLSLGIRLHLKNIAASNYARLNEYEKSFELAEQCYEEARIFYNTMEQDVIAEVQLTMARCYVYKQNFNEAECLINNSIKVLESIFGGKYVDPSQACAHVQLGDVYEQTNRLQQALKELMEVKEYYLNLYKDKIYNMFEVKKLYIKISNILERMGELNLYKNYIHIIQKFNI
ncbi:tpr repeat-containing protein (plasmid) [Rickettsiales bacterium Ac37b]|nr:tpr repeat-containing protein [Rickettsiales bacterium Ac37b]